MRRPTAAQGLLRDAPEAPRGGASPPCKTFFPVSSSSFSQCQCDRPLLGSHGRESRRRRKPVPDPLADFAPGTDSCNDVGCSRGTAHVHLPAACPPGAFEHDGKRGTRRHGSVNRCGDSHAGEVGDKAVGAAPVGDGSALRAPGDRQRKRRTGDDNPGHRQNLDGELLRRSHRLRGSVGGTDE